MDAVPDDILKLILPCIDSPLCLIRAASTCKRWRHIITSDGFLSHFLSLHHTAPIAGTYYNGESSSSDVQPPDFVPSPDKISGRHFSLDFLPDSNIKPWAWRISDSRGSLLLLLDHLDEEGSTRYGAGDVVICEPLTRSSKKISPCATFGDGYVLICAFLLDGDDSEACSSMISMSNFRVLCMVYGNYLYHASVYTSGGSWREISINSQIMDLVERMDLVDLLGPAAASLCLYAGGIGCQRMDLVGVTMTSLYWYSGGKRVVALDRRSAEVTSFVLPGMEDWDRLNMSSLMRITEDKNDTVRIVVSAAGGDVTIYLKITAGGWAQEEMSIQYPEEEENMMMPSHSKPWEFVTTCAPLIVVSPYRQGTWMLRLDGEIAAVERVRGVAYPCRIPWPPAFHACTGNDSDAT